MDITFYLPYKNFIFEISVKRGIIKESKSRENIKLSRRFSVHYGSTTLLLRYFDFCCWLQNGVASSRTKIKKWNQDEILDSRRKSDHLKILKPMEILESRRKFGSFWKESWIQHRKIQGINLQRNNGRFPSGLNITV